MDRAIEIEVCEGMKKALAIFKSELSPTAKEQIDNISVLLVFGNNEIAYGERISLKDERVDYYVKTENPQG